MKSPEAPLLVEPFLYRRPVRFEDCDPAAIVFFPRFFNFCLEALEGFFAPLDGGLPRLVLERRIGLSTVKIDAEFVSPLRFGDTMELAVTAERIGTKSFTLLHHITGILAGEHVASVRQTCVTTALDPHGAIAIPEDLRAVLRAHAVGAAVYF